MLSKTHAKISTIFYALLLFDNPCVNIYVSVFVKMKKKMELSYRDYVYEFAKQYTYIH